MEEGAQAEKREAAYLYGIKAKDLSEVELDSTSGSPELVISLTATKAEIDRTKNKLAVSSEQSSGGENTKTLGNGKTVSVSDASVQEATGRAAGNGSTRQAAGAAAALAVATGLIAFM